MDIIYTSKEHNGDYEMILYEPSKGFEVHYTTWYGTNTIYYKTYPTLAKALEALKDFT
jgi:hypothetical protein